MTFTRLVKAITVMALLAVALQIAVDSDTWWHLAAGRWMASEGRILQSDVFSATRSGAVWVNPGWLAQLILYGVFRLLGVAGLNVLTAAIAVGSLWLLWPRLDGPELLRAFVLLLAASAAAIFWAARPHMFSFLFSAAYLAILEDWRSGKEVRLWLLPVLMVLWANLHGGFVIGFLLLGAYLVGSAIEATLFRDGGVRERLKSAWRRTGPLAATGLLAALAVSANPHGPSLLLYPFQTISIGPLQNYIQEWQSPDFHSPQAQPFAWMLLATALVLALSRRRKDVIELVLTFGFGYLSLMAARNIATFALVGSPVLSRHAADVISRMKWETDSRPLPASLTRLLNIVLIVLTFTGLVIWSLPRLTDAGIRPVLEDRFPVRAVDYLARAEPAGPIVHSYNWGGYLIWRLWPEYQTYVDGRTDLFGEEILNEYLVVWSAGPGWREIVERRGFWTALLEPHAPLVLALRSEGWQVSYQDEQAVVLEDGVAQAGQE